MSSRSFLSKSGLSAAPDRYDEFAIDGRPKPVFIDRSIRILGIEPTTESLPVQRAAAEEQFVKRGVHILQVDAPRLVPLEVKPRGPKNREQASLKTSPILSQTMI